VSGGVSGGGGDLPEARTGDARPAERGPGSGSGMPDKAGDVSGVGPTGKKKRRRKRRRRTPGSGPSSGQDSGPGSGDGSKGPPRNTPQNP